MLIYFQTNRLWSSGCRSRYQGFVGRMRFMRSPFCIIGMADMADLLFIDVFIYYCTVINASLLMIQNHFQMSLPLLRQSLF